MIISVAKTIFFIVVMILLKIACTILVSFVIPPPASMIIGVIFLLGVAILMDSYILKWLVSGIFSLIFMMIVLQDINDGSSTPLVWNLFFLITFSSIVVFCAFQAGINSSTQEVEFK